MLERPRCRIPASSTRSGTLITARTLWSTKVLQKWPSSVFNRRSEPFCSSQACSHPRGRSSSGPHAAFSCGDVYRVFLMYPASIAKIKNKKNTPLLENQAGKTNGPSIQSTQRLLNDGSSSLAANKGLNSSISCSGMRDAGISLGAGCLRVWARGHPCCERASQDSPGSAGRMGTGMGTWGRAESPSCHVPPWLREATTSPSPALRTPHQHCPGRCQQWGRLFQARKRELDSLLSPFLPCKPLVFPALNQRSHPLPP